LTDWGIFSPERVRLHVEQQKRVELK
jgi:hypothetical protein